MKLGAASRSALVVAPIVSALSALALAGVFRPEWISPGLGTTPLAAALAATGAATAVALAVAVSRAPDPVRRAWLSSVVATPLLTAAGLGVLLSWPDALTWGVLRTAAFAVLGYGIVAGQFRRRTTRQWASLLMGGWLVAASVFIIAWVALGLTGSVLGDRGGPLHAALYWLPADLLAASLVAGLAMHARGDRRIPVLLAVLAALLVLVSDTLWALTATAAFGAVTWIIMLGAMGGSTLLGPLDLWQDAGPADAYPPLLRLPQWALVPGLIFATIRSGDQVTVAAAISVILGLAGELATTGRQNHHLWRALRKQAQRLDQLLAESRDALVHVDHTGTVRFASEAVSGILGCPPEDIVGRDGAELVHPDDRGKLLADIRRIGLGDPAGGGGRVSARFRHTDGGWRTVEATVSRRTSGDAGYILSARDVSERQSMERKLLHLAGTDALTQLANRPAFLTLLDERLREGPAAVLFVDLDGFKSVNDMDGHAAGDRLLQEVARTLQRELRGRDVAARLGGDEFAILLGTDQSGESRAVADRLVQRLGRMPADPARRTAASIGVAIGHAVTAETLLGDADLAMYEAKARGGRRHVMFEPWMRERVTERARMSEALQRACQGQGLLLDVQPIVTLNDHSCVGYEALARWQDGERRRPPSEFLPVAEENGLIDPLGRWVLHEALTWLARWPDQRTGISVNVAGSQLATAGFGDWVHRQLADFNLAPSRLTLEISERTALGDLQRATTVLQPLRALGVRVALDDFGTGFSSLGHLADVQVDELKIDKRFVTNLGRRQQDEALVRAVCQLADDLKLRVVAEGVETAAQESILIEHGCQLGQGYRYHEPMPAQGVTYPAEYRPAASPPALRPAATGPASAPHGLPTWPPDGQTVAS